MSENFSYTGDFDFEHNFNHVLQTLPLSENSPCTGDFEFERKFSPVLETLRLNEKVAIGISLCTGGFELGTKVPVGISTRY